jgi:hypothetical protein
MALDQSGEHRAPGGVERGHGRIAPFAQDLVGLADRHDRAVPDGHCSVGDQIQLALGAGAARRPMVTNPRHLRGVHDVEVTHEAAAVEATCPA